MIRIYGKDNSGEFGSIILDNFEFFNQGYKPSEIGIKFGNAIVSGKYLNEEENKLIKDKFNTTGFSIVIYDLPESYIEGKESLVIHIKKERNPLVRQDVIRNFLTNNERVYCEACGFDFYDKYGELGKDYIECHHTKPIHQMDGETETKLDDMVLLCSNCHRMIHRYSPMLTIQELKDKITRNTGK
ncbi:HNH endonuclease [Macrococcus sp. EM39E]|uniref:HNH endonuclease n=1 Tax=Macrococcus animalis TaxID=3395467 RepID=UPI0039BE2E4A